MHHLNTSTPWPPGPSTVPSVAPRTDHCRGNSHMEPFARPLSRVAASVWASLCLHFCPTRWFTGGHHQELKLPPLCALTPCGIGKFSGILTYSSIPHVAIQCTYMGHITTHALTIPNQSTYSLNSIIWYRLSTLARTMNVYWRPKYLSSVPGIPTRSGRDRNWDEPGRTCKFKFF
jgi:hypothetical protein